MPCTGFKIDETIILRIKRSLAPTQYFSVQIAGIFTYQALADTLNRLTDLFHGNRNLRIIQGVWPSQLLLNEYYRIEPYLKDINVKAHSRAILVDVSEYKNIIRSSQYECNELMTTKDKGTILKSNKSKDKEAILKLNRDEDTEGILKLNRDEVKKQFLYLHVCSKRTKIFKKFKTKIF